MSNHGLTRNSENEPVCACGYRPEILDEPAPVGKQWKARTAVLDHAKARNEDEAALRGERIYSPEEIRAFGEIHFNDRAKRSPDAPFIVQDARYPRAGVRPTADGRWLLTLWDDEDVRHPIAEPEFDELAKAFDYGWLTIGACRQSGTSLNGMAAA